MERAPSIFQQKEIVVAVNIRRSGPDEQDGHAQRGEQQGENRMCPGWFGRRATPPVEQYLKKPLKTRHEGPPLPRTTSVTCK